MRRNGPSAAKNPELIRCARIASAVSIEDWQIAPPQSAGAHGDAVFLQAQRHELLRGDVTRMQRRRDRLHPAAGPAFEHARSQQHALVVEAQEQAVAGAFRPPPGAAEAPQEGGDGAGGADLDHPIEVADIDPEFQGFAMPGRGAAVGWSRSGALR